ncbi:MAG: ATP-binding cassette domain-containing protein [Desulfobacterales bacterium]
MSQKTKLIYEVKDLKKVYDNRIVLQIGRLQFHPGTIYGIIGPIGSGKSTLFRILAGQEMQTGGAVTFEGQAFETGWFGKIKGNENIVYASSETLPEPKKVSQLFLENYPKKVKNIQSKYFSKGVQKSYWEQTIKNLSPGEQAWISMILAVESDPRVLLVDDYGTLLDGDSEYDFRRKLKKMNKDLGTTIILAAPTDKNIKKIAAVLIYLDHGHVSKIRPGVNRGNSQGYRR